MLQTFYNFSHLHKYVEFVSFHIFTHSLNMESALSFSHSFFSVQVIRFQDETLNWLMDLMEVCFMNTST